MRAFSLLVLFLAVCRCFSIAQSHKLYIVAVPNLTSQPKVMNPSPAKIYGNNTFGLETKLLYNYITKSQFGVVLGVNAGLVNWNYNIEAPYTAFGTHKDYGMLNYRTYSTDYHYVGSTIGGSYECNLKGHQFHIEAGATLRLYPNDLEGDTTGAAFNRDPPYNPWDPNAGKPDFLSGIPPAIKKVFPNIYLSVSFPIAISKHSSLHVGVTKSWALKLLGEGDMFVQYDEKFYYGKYSPRTSYLGLDLRYGYTFIRKKK